MKRVHEEFQARRAGITGKFEEIEGEITAYKAHADSLNQTADIGTKHIAAVGAHQNMYDNASLENLDPLKDWIWARPKSGCSIEATIFDEAWKRIKKDMDDVGNRIVTLKECMGMMTGGHNRAPRAILEAVSNLKEFQNDRSEYTTWIEKFIHVCGQATNGGRTLMQDILDHACKDVLCGKRSECTNEVARKLGTSHEALAIAGEDIQAILVGKTKGEALKIVNGERGDALATL